MRAGFYPISQIAGYIQFLSMISWSWSWSISWSWSRSISWGWSRSISWSWSIGWSWSVVTILVVFDETLIRAGNPLVLHVSVVLLVLVHEVVHDLNSAVWELHSVLAWGEREELEVMSVTAYHTTGCCNA